MCHIFEQKKWDKSRRQHNSVYVSLSVNNRVDAQQTTTQFCLRIMINW